MSAENHGNIAKLGVVYELHIDTPPVPKSTQRPPRIENRAYRAKVIMSDPKYKRLAATLRYQQLVANTALAMGFPHFLPEDPIDMGFIFRKVGHETGDTKNLIAAVEDGLQYGQIIPNDRQVRGYLFVETFYFDKNPSVFAVARISNIVHDDELLFNWLNKSRKKMEAYKRLRGL